MRRSLLVVALLLGVAVGFLPNGATADHCTRVWVMTGVSGPVNNPTTGQPAGLRYYGGSPGCTNAAAHFNSHRIVPGSNTAAVRITQEAKQPLPVAGTLSFLDKTVDLELQPNTADPAQATLFDSQFVTIDYTKIAKLVVKVTFADGSEITGTYTK